MTLRRKLSTMGIRLIVAKAQNTVRNILLLTNMHKMLSIDDSLALAPQGSKTSEAPRA